MAKIDKYVDSNYINYLQQDAKTKGGARLVPYCFTVNVAAADSDGSVYRLGSFSASTIFYDIIVSNTAITGGTDYDVGFYRPRDFRSDIPDLDAQGATQPIAIDKDALVAEKDFSSATRLYGFSGPSLDDLLKPIKDFSGVNGLGANDPVDLCVTANTVGDDGTILVQVLTLET